MHPGECVELRRCSPPGSLGAGYIAEETYSPPEGRTKRQMEGEVALRGACGWQSDVVADEGVESLPLLDLDVLAMLDQPNGTKEHGQHHGPGRPAFAFFALCSTQPNLRVSHLEVVEPDRKIPRLPHHSRFRRLGDLTEGMGSGSGNNHIAHLKIVDKSQCDRVSFSCCLGAQVLRKGQIHINALPKHVLAIRVRSDRCR